MYRRIFSLMAAVLIVSSAFNQSLYVPRNIRQAYTKGTRSTDGSPGPNYWQNTGKYDIEVTAMPPDRTIRGKEQITYINNSPDTLRNIVFRLVLNVHQAGAPRISPADSAYLSTGIRVDSFTENGVIRNWRAQREPRTIQGYHLSRPLLPHDSVKFGCQWHYEISRESQREGMIDSTTYYLAYFYPRVSVYDDYNGWDVLDFTDQQEFYNDFNDYTLTVFAPRNYIVWATGDLQNPGTVLQPGYAARLEESMRADSVLHLVTTADLASKKVTRQEDLNAWRWKANHVSDMAVGLSDHYLWDASSVVVDSTTGRRASVQAAYKPAAADFRQSVSNAAFALSWFSRNWPGVPYPFPKMTAFQGFADMEYPMMVNDASTGSEIFSRFVQDHEIAHTYFPFYMGINESRYAFMDEGWATTLELLIGRDELGKEKAENFYKQFRVRGWINDKSSEEDLPVITPANMLNGIGYGNNAYGKPSLGYLAMKELLGDAMFKKCLHEYMARWHGKHPIPWDFFYTFNYASGRNLDWFWKNWFFSNNYIDFGMKNVVRTKTGYTLTIENIGGYMAPFDLHLVYADGTSEVKRQTPQLWQAREQTATLQVRTGKKLKSAAIEGGIFMDADESNNRWTAK